MKTTFIAPNGIEVEGIVLYISPIARDSKSFVNRVYDEIVYAQNRLVKLHHTLKPDDEDNYEEDYFCRYDHSETNASFVKISIISETIDGKKISRID